MRDNPSHPLFVLYDGWCPLCQRTVRVLRRLDWLRRLEPIDFRRMDLPAFNARYGLNLTLDALDKEMYVVRRGRASAGFDGYRVLVAALPLGWLMLPWLYLPGMLALGRWIYGIIARNRPRLLHCDDHCAVPHAAAADAHDRTGMTRDLDALANRTYDVVIVGGGIYGACLARAAAQAGLAAALVEQGDFGGATSANSQKILHGGFRYLQHADLRRVRESIRARRFFLRAAPHLAHPLPVLIPTHARGVQRRGLLRIALALYDLIAWDRNRGIRDPQNQIPRSRVLSRAECLRLLPGLAPEGVTGGAVWHDGQVCHTERLTLALVQSAVQAGAVAANHVRVTGFIQEPGRVAGVRAQDVLTGRALTVRARLTITTAGPWVNRVLGLADERLRVPLALSKTLCVTVNRPLTNGRALSVAHTGPDGRERRLFVTPWRGASLVGATHACAEDTDALRATDAEVRELLAAVNAAYPGARLRREEITDAYVGLLPRQTRRGDTDPSHLTGRYQIVDHARIHGLEGLLSIVSVKYTVACTVAERTLRMALRKLGVQPRGRRPEEPVWGGDLSRLEDVFVTALAAYGQRLGAPVVRDLVHLYGTQYRAVAALTDADEHLAAPLSPATLTIGAQVVHAVREEMAQTLADVVLRRTALAALGHPGEMALRACADLMAPLLGWDAGRTASELEAVERLLTKAGALPTAEAVR